MGREMANRLLRLLNDNRAAPRRFEIVNAASDEPTIYLYDVIVSDDWFGGVSAQSFVQQLAQITASTIHLRVNSPGGDVFAGRAIEQAIREHPANIIAHVDGYAASAATYPTLAANEIVMADGAFIMIHKASGSAWGNGDDLRATAAVLDKIDESLVTTYANKTGQSPEDIAAWLEAETWFSATEAVELGFADSVATGSAASNAACWNMSAYANAPPLARGEPASREPAQQPAPKNSAPPPKPAVDVAALKRRLALNASR